MAGRSHPFDLEELEPLFLEDIVDLTGDPLQQDFDVPHGDLGSEASLFGGETVQSQEVLSEPGDTVQPQSSVVDAVVEP